MTSPNQHDQFSGYLNDASTGYAIVQGALHAAIEDCEKQVCQGPAANHYPGNRGDLRIAGHGGQTTRNPKPV